MISSSGAILSNRQVSQADGTSIWTNHGFGSAQAGDRGVSAASFTEGGNVNELVVYVATDGKLNVGRVINGGSIAWTSIDPPIGRTLTGNAAAITDVQGSTRYLVVGATTTDGHLFRYVGIVNSGFVGGWSDASAGLIWLTNTPLAATASPDETIATVFAAHTQGNQSLGMFRWNGSTWATTNLGHPAGKPACRTLAAAQGNLTGLAGGERVLVACTSAANSSQELHIATATGYGSTAFTWNTYLSPISGFYQGLAAVVRDASPVLVGSRIDVYGITNAGIDKGTLGTSSFSLTYIGAPPEGNTTTGNPVAIPSGTASRAFFVAGAFRKHLYERYGGNTSSAPQNYRAFGHDDPTGLVWNGTYAEGKLSSYKGVMAAAVISRPGVGSVTDFPRTYLMYSNDEETLYPPTVIPNVVSGKTYNFVSDPTASVSTNGSIYTVQEGVEMSSCSGGAGQTSNAIYLAATSVATYPTFSTPILIESHAGQSLDHPYSDIEHRTSSPDLVHIAWWRINSGIAYGAYVAGSTSAPIVRSLSTSGGEAPRVTASDTGRVIVYYPTSGGQVQICEVQDTDGDHVPDACCLNGVCGPTAWQSLDPGPQRADGSYPLLWSTPGGGQGGPGVSGSNVYIRAAVPVAMTISESGDTLYYCFQQNETNGDGPDADTREEADAYCTTGTRDPSTGIFTWNTNPILISGGSRNDDHDQFAPEVLLTQENGSYAAPGETAIVTYYDRSDDPANYLYTVKKVVSTNRFASAFPPKVQFNGASSDPEYLPRHCFDSNIRFIGDYAGAEGDVLHGHSMAVTVPTPGTIGSTLWSNFNALGSWAR